VALSALLAWLCASGLTAPRMLSTPSVKTALGDGAIEARAAWFAPIPYGYDETNLTEIHRPPTWTAASEIDAFGRYVRGARAMAGDPSGFAPTSTPVEVRAHEPALDSIARHWMGTDALGRDVLARVLWGARPSLLVAALATLCVTVLGVALGAIAGYFRGALDLILSALIQLLQSFPTFLLMLAAIAIVGDGALGARASPLAVVVAVIALVGWTGIARLVRAETLRVRELDYVAAARALGLPQWRILLVHVVPNAIQPAIAAMAFAAAGAILIESAVSFFGFGVRAPTPSWGAVMQEARSTAHVWTFVFPGLLIFATCAACAWIGDALRDALDPREAA
jgi:peptide/nickel transport system permease protein